MNKKVIAIVVAVSIFAVYFPTYLVSFDARNSQVEGCERINEGVRGPLFDFFQSAAESRYNQAEITEGKERQVNLQTARQYERESQEMLNAIDDENRVTNHRPEVDCKSAFQKPFPF